ncbi:MAG TPA: spore germination protein GerW family protein [Actinomycetota bacterium]|nr:spore germination protein GerW family protein [Actinomycetota bacterium]
MDLKEFIGKGQETMTVRRVFGEPYVQNGVTVVPAARIRGAVGGGGGDDKSESHQGEGEGGGLILHAAPVGVYVIRGEKVTWVPSFDLNRVILGAQLTAVVALVVSRSWAPRSSGRKARFGRKHLIKKGS